MFLAEMDFDGLREDKVQPPGEAYHSVRRGPCGTAGDKARRKIPLRGTGTLGCIVLEKKKNGRGDWI